MAFELNLYFPWISEKKYACTRGCPFGTRSICFTRILWNENLQFNIQNLYVHVNNKRHWLICSCLCYTSIYRQINNICFSHRCYRQFELNERSCLRNTFSRCINISKFLCLQYQYHQKEPIYIPRYFGFNPNVGSIALHCL